MEISRRSLGHDPRTWPPVEREEIQRYLDLRWKESHRSMNDKATDDDDDD